MTGHLLHRPSLRRQPGFGIIEIMIALALGVIIMLGVTQVATNNSSTRYELERAGAQMENAVFALREIEADLTNAGYWGELGTQTAGTLPVICPTTACDLFAGAVPGDLNGAAEVASTCDLNRALHYPVQGGSATVATPTFPCVTAVATNPVNTITPKLATDYLAIRRVNSCAVGSPGCEAAGSNFHLQVNACFAEGVAGAPLPGIDYVIAPRVTTLDTSIFKYKERAETCSTAGPAPQYRFLNRIYYIDADRLMRAELAWNAAATAQQYQQTALVEGVELMRFEYGLDNSGDGQVDAYTNVPTAGDWPNVVMVRVSLVVRSAEASPGFDDKKSYTIAGTTYCTDDPVDPDTGDDDDAYDGPCDLDIPAAFENHRRQLYTRTVSLRNVAGRRET